MSSVYEYGYAIARAHESALGLGMHTVHVRVHVRNVRDRKQNVGIRATQAKVHTMAKQLRHCRWRSWHYRCLW